MRKIFHCFFEQSGTFKNEFKKLGYEAYDYDIQNEFNETDNVIDLFLEIDKAFINQPSIFDKITSEDTIIAFFLVLDLRSKYKWLLEGHNFK